MPEVDLPKDIGAPATRALVAGGYTRLAQLANVPIAGLKPVHGVGPRALTRLQQGLEQQGMSLGLSGLPNPRECNLQLPGDRRSLCGCRFGTARKCRGLIRGLTVRTGGCHESNLERAARI